MKAKWTIPQVKEQLPPITAAYRNKTYQAHISGRKLDFPKVSIDLGGGEWVSVEFAWQTVVDCLNDGKPAL